jgi:hypothetical protein
VDRRNRITRGQHQRSNSQPESSSQRNTTTPRRRPNLYQQPPTLPLINTLLPQLSPPLIPVRPRSGNLSPVSVNFDTYSQTRSPTAIISRSPATSESGSEERSDSPIENRDDIKGTT